MTQTEYRILSNATLVDCHDWVKQVGVAISLGKPIDNCKQTTNLTNNKISKLNQ